ncbi:MAG: hydrogenase maturation protease [Planctomycetes bacterium]|nr:hydrogenase maturation protease [Planctomycetota bacterium]
MDGLDAPSSGPISRPCHSGETSSHAGISTAEHLAEHLLQFIRPPLAVVCVGSELSGDDGLGPAVARKFPSGPWEVHDAQTVPESFLIKIARHRPCSLILVDAVDFGAAPGSVDLLAMDKISAGGPAAHGPAPLGFLDLLQAVYPCRVAVLAVQPQRLALGQTLSEPVRQAVSLILQAFRLLLP